MSLGKRAMTIAAEHWGALTSGEMTSKEPPGLAAGAIKPKKMTNAAAQFCYKATMKGR